MDTETAITVDGVKVPDGMDIAQAIEALERPPADRFLLVKDGKPESEIMWDGVTPFDPGDGVELHRTSEWKGDVYTGPPEPTEAKARRTRNERTDGLAQRVTEDIAAWDTLTANQRAAATLRGLRLLRNVVRELRDDTGADE